MWQGLNYFGVFEDPQHSSTGRRWWDRSASGSSSRSPSDRSGGSPSVSFVGTPLRALGGAESLWQRSSPPLLLVREQLGVATWDFIDREDSVSACSKNTYLAANNRARESVMTCSRSTLREKEIITSDWINRGAFTLNSVMFLSSYLDMVLSDSMFVAGRSTSELLMLCVWDSVTSRLRAWTSARPRDWSRTRTVKGHQWSCIYYITNTVQILSPFKITFYVNIVTAWSDQICISASLLQSSVSHDLQKS